MNIEIPHIALPARIVDGHLAVLEQDSPEEISQCVGVLLRTHVGQRDDSPEYGIPDGTFSQGGVDTEALAAAIGRWEPRASTDVTNPDSPYYDEELERGIDHVIAQLEERADG